MPYHIHITGQVLPVGHHVPFRVLLGIAGQQATKVTVFDAQAKRIAVIRIIVIILGAYDLDFRAAQGKGIPLRRVGHRHSLFFQCVLQGLINLGIGGIVGHQRLLHRRGVERAHQTADVILVIVGSHQPFQFGHPVLLEIGDHIGGGPSAPAVVEQILSIRLHQHRKPLPHIQHGQGKCRIVWLSNRWRGIGFLGYRGNRWRWRWHRRRGGSTGGTGQNQCRRQNNAGDFSKNILYHRTLLLYRASVSER